MPAQSQQQQKLFGLALSVKRGETPRSDASEDVLGIVDSMTEKEIEDFASTSHKGLPKKVEQQIREMVREIMRERAISEMTEGKDFKRVKKDKYGNHLEPQFKKGDKVKYLGNKAVITRVNKESSGVYSYDVDYYKGNGRTKASNIFNKDGKTLQLESVNERLTNSDIKRMEGLHSYKKMDEALKSLVFIGKELYEEGFEKPEITEFILKKVQRRLFLQLKESVNEKVIKAKDAGNYVKMAKPGKTLKIGNDTYTSLGKGKWKGPNGEKLNWIQVSSIASALGNKKVSYESKVNEGIEPQIKKIAHFTGTRPEAVEDFVSKHALNITKLLKYVEKGGLPQRMELVSALAGRPNNPTQKKIIKMFNESINEGYSTEEKRIVMMSVRKIAKYMNVDLETAMNYVLGAGQELQRDIKKGKIKK